VVWQPYQFSWTRDKLSDELTDRVAAQLAYDIAWEALTTVRVSEATHYHATYTTPYWAPKLEFLEKIGNHLFYK
jgi:spore germination cell wall hydrolase CwlJ-like protein